MKGNKKQLNFGKSKRKNKLIEIWIYPVVAHLVW